MRNSKDTSELLIKLTYKNIRQIIIDERESREWKRYELAEKLETQPSTMLRYEKGTYVMNIPLFMRVCQILEMSPDQVFSTAYKKAKAEIKKKRSTKEKD